MSGRFVRASKFRHVYGQPTKKEFCYDSLHITNNAWDSNIIKVNPLYLSVNWEASGGGAFAVIPLEERGKAPGLIPLFRGHTAAVLDTDWNPFDDSIVASGSDDGKVGIFKVPEGFSIHVEPDEIQDVLPAAMLSGHKRKVGHVKFHPVASNVLATSSNDYSIKLWDIEAGKPKTTLQHKDLVTSFDFNFQGSLIASVSRDKKIRIWDPRSEEIVQEGPGHGGAKNSRIVWMGQHDRLATTGFSRLSDRQVAIWDSSDISKGPLGGFTQLDSSSGICMPFYDDGTHCLYLAGKGDGNIRYFEYENDQLYSLSEYKSIEPQRGVAFMPKRALNIRENEVVRMYKTVNDTLVEPISFIVPRRSDNFQDDIYPDCSAGEAALTSSEFFAGKTSNPKLISLVDIYEGHDAVAKVVEKPVIEAAPSTVQKIPTHEKIQKKSESSSQGVNNENAVYRAPEKDLNKVLNTSSVSKLLEKASNTEDPDVKLPREIEGEKSSWDDYSSDTKGSPKKNELQQKSSDDIAKKASVSSKSDNNLEENNLNKADVTPSPSPKKAVSVSVEKKETSDLKKESTSPKSLAKDSDKDAVKATPKKAADGSSSSTISTTPGSVSTKVGGISKQIADLHATVRLLEAEVKEKSSIIETLSKELDKVKSWTAESRLAETGESRILKLEQELESLKATIAQKL